MLNNTSSYKKNIQVDFISIGFDIKTSAFLNKCLFHRQNIEFILECNIFDKVSQQSVLHHDHLKVIREIDDVIKHKRT